MKKALFKGFILAGLVITGFIGFGSFSAEANSCGFYRDLGLGSRGEDVRCLQQFLINSGYGGSMGVYGADGVFGSRTSMAVMAWQGANSLQVSGYFDAASRARFVNIYGGSSGQVLGASINMTDMERASMRIKEALEMIDDAEEEIDDSNHNTSRAEDLLEDAKDDIDDAIREFFIFRDYDEAYDRADDAFKNAEDAFDEVDGDGDREDARDAINDAREAIDDARDEIERADRNGADVDEAWDLLDEAEDKLDDAEDEFDDHDYDEAEDSAHEAEDLAEEAVDAIDW